MCIRASVNATCRQIQMVRLHWNSRSPTSTMIVRVTSSGLQLSALQLSALQLSALQLSALQLSALQLSALQLSALQLDHDLDDHVTEGE